jgi:type IV secretion system protein VirB8
LFELFKKQAGGDDKSVLESAKNWYSDRYESMVVQRNALFLLSLASAFVIALSVSYIRYLKSSNTIEPFVIEIEKKTGVTTVVDPVTIQAYAAEESVKRYFIMKYIRAREEYTSATFKDNFNNVVRVLSAGYVYGAYRAEASPNNAESVAQRYSTNSTRTVELKSIVFKSERAAQVRIKILSEGSLNRAEDKIVLIEYNFSNMQMNPEERLINPLGFQVTLYRIENDSS